MTHRTTAAARTRFMTMLAVTVTSAAIFPSVAHHSGAAYDRSQTLQISGEVTSWRFANPHSWLQISVTDEHGNAQVWDFEGLPAGMLAPRGYRRNSFAPQDHVTVFYRSMADGRPGGGNLQGAVLADGTTVGTIPAEQTQ